MRSKKITKSAVKTKVESAVKIEEKSTKIGDGISFAEAARLAMASKAKENNNPDAVKVKASVGNMDSPGNNKKSNKPQRLLGVSPRLLGAVKEAPKLSNADDITKPPRLTGGSKETEESAIESAADVAKHSDLDEVLPAQKTDDATSSDGVVAYIKHPLENAWNFWHLNRDATIAWEDQLEFVKTVEFVEDFWSVVDYVLPPSAIRAGCDYLFFKKGIRPMWEDDANKLGGRWVISVNVNKPKKLDELWLDTLLSLIGEAYENSHDICGAVANVRNKVLRVAFWTANAQNGEAVLAIGRKWKNYLHFPNEIVYEVHAESSKSGADCRPLYKI